MIGRTLSREAPRDVAWKKRDRAWEVSEGKSCNGSSEVSLQHGHNEDLDMLMCLFEWLGEDMNWKGNLMQHIISILVDISYD